MALSEGRGARTIESADLVHGEPGGYLEARWSVLMLLFVLCGLCLWTAAAVAQQPTSVGAPETFRAQARTESGSMSDAKPLAGIAGVFTAAATCPWGHPSPKGSSRRPRPLL